MSEFWSPTLAWLSLSVSCMLRRRDSGKILLWSPLFSRCVSLWMLSTLNMSNWTSIPFLLILNLPPSSPPRLGCEIVILLWSSISWWHWIIFVYLLQITFVIFHRWIDFCHLRLKYSPIGHCILSGLSYRSLGVWIVVVYPAILLFATPLFPGFSLAGYDIMLLVDKRSTAWDYNGMVMRNNSFRLWWLKIVNVF